MNWHYKIYLYDTRAKSGHGRKK